MDRIVLFTICWLLFVNLPWIESEYLYDELDQLSIESDILDNEIKQFALRETYHKCNANLKREIKKYYPVVKHIFNEVLEGSFKRKTWRALATFVDKFGSRIAGSKNLEKAIDYMLDLSKQNGMENVHGEEVSVPHWVR